MTFYTTLFAPRHLPRFFLHNASTGFTLAFSNTPGPLKHYVFDDNEGHRCTLRHVQTYVMTSGRVGMCISCISQGDTFTITMICDEAICQEPQVIVDMM